MSKIETEAAKFQNNPILYIDCFGETDDNKYDFPCMFLIIGNAVMSITFRNSFKNTTNDGTLNIVNREGNTAPYISSFDLVVNGYVVTRRRYGSPGVARATAHSDASKLLKDIYKQVKDELSEETQNVNVTTLSRYPKNAETISIDNLLRGSKSDNL